MEHQEDLMDTAFNPDKQRSRSISRASNEHDSSAQQQTQKIFEEKIKNLEGELEKQKAEKEAI